jgi:excisionase family DNA binding protein
VIAAALVDDPIDALINRAMKAWRPTPYELTSLSRYNRRIEGATLAEIAQQDGVSLACVAQSIHTFIKRAGLPPVGSRPMPGRIAATQVAEALGVTERTVLDWASRGLIPSVRRGKNQYWFVLDEVRAALAAASWDGCHLLDPNRAKGRRAAERAETPDMRTCSACKKLLPLSLYPPSSMQTAAWTCRPCRYPYARARDIRRYRLVKGSRCEPVSHAVVAVRDGWLCGICGGKVKKENWSLDHVVPISKGGSHTYDNVVLAHLLCNIRRGAGRLPVQAPLFAKLPPPPTVPTPGYKGTGKAVDP